MRKDVVLASTFGWDISDLREYRYQQHRATIPIWAIGNRYFTVTKGDKPPRDERNWRKYSDQTFAAPNGMTIWES
jgi:hypothetical protein